MKKFNLFVLTALVAVCSMAFATEPGMPSMEEMMKNCTIAGTPGPEHAALAKHAGTWDCVVKMWMDPTQPPMESKGTETSEVVLGGRAVASHFTGDMMGTPFHGMGMTGYSVFAKKYWSTWTDDMSTGMMYAEGTASADGKTITLMGTMDDPMMNVMDKPWKQVMKLIDDDHSIFEAYDGVGTPHEFKAMEITYTRKK